MRHLRWIPLAFVADVHGFAIFAPYAAFMMAVAVAVEVRHRRGSAARAGAGGG